MRPYHATNRRPLAPMLAGAIGGAHLCVAAISAGALVTGRSTLRRRAGLAAPGGGPAISAGTLATGRSPSATSSGTAAPVEFPPFPQAPWRREDRRRRRRAGRAAAGGVPAISASALATGRSPAGDVER